METIRDKYSTAFASKIAEYVWIDGYGELRSKIKILPDDHYSIENMPIWNFDGSSTKQASTQNSEVVLRPASMYKNPFHPGGYLVLCDTFIQIDGNELSPHQSNSRYNAMKFFQYSDYFQPWYGLEQEYFILDPVTDEPFGFEKDKRPKQGKYYCGTQNGVIKGRAVAEAHMRACLTAGLKVSGINAEVGPSQWEYQIGPVEGVEAADQLWVSRYILQRVAEEAGVKVSFHPKPVGEDWAGSGCHSNFSTIQMRLPQGYEFILKTINVLEQTHEEYVKACGLDSARRLTGDHETANITNFSWGVGSRHTSIRIPKETEQKQCGYLEDRRPSSNMDPYQICSMLLAAAIAVSENNSAST